MSENDTYKLRLTSPCLNDWPHPLQNSLGHLTHLKCMHPPLAKSYLKWHRGHSEEMISFNSYTIMKGIPMPLACRWAASPNSWALGSLSIFHLAKTSQEIPSWAGSHWVVNGRQRTIICYLNSHLFLAISAHALATVGTCHVNSPALVDEAWATLSLYGERGSDCVCIYNLYSHWHTRQSLGRLRGWTEGAWSTQRLDVF